MKLYTSFLNLTISKGLDFKRYRVHAFIILIVLIMMVGVFRISSTYSFFWQTWDEPAHIAAGMEWLDKGQYTYEHLHPPLARVMSALGPYLAGSKSMNKADMMDEGHAILHANSQYEKNLTLARIGILPFFIIASLVVALWAAIYGGMIVSLLSLVLFSTLPVILGHSGVATLDMPCAALVTATLFSFVLWLDKPTFLRSILLGLTAGLAIMSKFSSLSFLIASGGLIWAIYGFEIMKKKISNATATFKYKQWLIFIAVIILACFFVIWAGYRFSYDIVKPENEAHRSIDRIVGVKGSLHDVVYTVIEKVPIPAPELIDGLSQVPARNKKGHLAYLYGDIRTQGWWYFYPIMLLLKTPIPFLLLVLIGIIFIVRHTVLQEHGLKILVPVSAAIGILAVGMMGNIDNGIRQVLAIYPFLSIIAGYGASQLFFLKNRYRFIALGLVTVLLAWQLISSIYAHPDYLAYFNEFGRKNPEEIAVGSDLDWGQDFKRLATVLKIREIKELSIKCNNSTGINLELLGFPMSRELIPYKKTFGWIAISVHHLKLGTRVPPYDQYSWLIKYKPVEKIGKTIWLYYIAEEGKKETTSYKRQ